MKLKLKSMPFEIGLKIAEENGQIKVDLWTVNINKLATKEPLFYNSFEVRPAIDSLPTVKRTLQAHMLKSLQISAGVDRFKYDYDLVEKEVSTQLNRFLSIDSLSGTKLTKRLQDVVE